jgi:hypothetical protein
VVTVLRCGFLRTVAPAHHLPATTHRPQTRMVAWGGLASRLEAAEKNGEQRGRKWPETGKLAARHSRVPIRESPPGLAFAAGVKKPETGSGF